MSERKVINKYYPPDYDPSKVPRIKKKSKQKDVRIMAPFNMKCTNCGNYIGCATKFNAKKEEVQGETYEGTKIFRLYFKCPRCMGSITVRTDPKEGGYEVESGATENFIGLKLAKKQATEEEEAAKEEEKLDPMKQLESRTKASRLQMEASERIQELRSIKHQYRSVNIDALIASKRQESEDTVLQLTSGSSTGISQEDDIKTEAMRLMMMKRKTTDSSNHKATAPSKRVQVEVGSSSRTSSLNIRIKVRVKPKTGTNK